jgi:hypothetical protein
MAVLRSHVVSVESMVLSPRLMCVRDMLAHLASVSNVPLPDPARGTAQKRTRDSSQATAMNKTVSFGSTEARDSRTATYPAAPIEPVPVIADGAPSFGLAFTMEPGTSLDVSAHGFLPPGSAPQDGHAQASASVLSLRGQSGERVMHNSAPSAGDGFSSYAPELGDIGEQPSWWACAHPAIADTSYSSDPMGTREADLNTIGTALDALLSRSGHTGVSLPGDDPLAIWTRGSLNSECARLSDAPGRC